MNFNASTFHLGVPRPRWADTAVSPEADAVLRTTLRVWAESFERSESISRRRSRAISDLRGMAVGCRSENWDGNGAEAISAQAVAHVERLISLWPAALPLPELAPEPDGSISLDWITSRYRLFSVSVGRSDRITYAWLNGTDRGHGVEFFDGEPFREECWTVWGKL
jgi:hypothetical protein